MKPILILAGMQTSEIVALRAQKSRRTQNESLFDAEFSPEE